MKVKAKEKEKKINLQGFLNFVFTFVYIWLMKSFIIDLRQSSKYVSIPGNCMFKFNSETEDYLLKVNITVNTIFILTLNRHFPSW